MVKIYEHGTTLKAEHDFSWAIHVMNVFKEYLRHHPKRDEILERIPKGAIFVSPALY
jgi:hypothetical protein